MGIRAKVAFEIQNQQNISETKRSGLEPKLLQCLQKLVYGLSIGDKSGERELWPTFPGSNIFHNG